MVMRRVLIGLGAVLALLLVIVVGAYLWLDTSSGRRFITGNIALYEFENGIKVRAARIEGSIYGDMRLVDVTFSDAKGVFASAKTVNVDWNPWPLVYSHVNIRSLDIPAARMTRRPLLKVVPPSDEPLLPDIDIDIDAFSLKSFVLEPAVTGKRHVMTLGGNMHIADRRAQIDAKASALAGPGLSGGDTLALVLDAVPDQNKLDLRASLDAPADGMLASYTNFAVPTRIELNGKGAGTIWNGQLSALVDGKPLADLALSARDGKFAAKGDVELAGLLGDGMGRNMLTPTTAIDLAMTLNERRALSMARSATAILC